MGFIYDRCYVILCIDVFWIVICFLVNVGLGIFIMLGSLVLWGS